MMKAMQKEDEDVVLDAMIRRRSVREYTDEPVSDETILRIIRAGIEAPTGMGIQPWRFVVVRNQHLLQRISDYCKPVLLESLRGVSDPLATEYRARLEDPAFSIFYGAPVLVIVAGDTRDPMSVYDCSLCAGNMLLAATAMGLGGCWIGSAETAQENADLIKELKIPKHYRIMAPLIFGHPKALPEKPARSDAVVTWIP